MCRGRSWVVGVVIALLYPPRYLRRVVRPLWFDLGCMINDLVSVLRTGVDVAI